MNKLVKSLLLAGSATLVAGVAAQAADLPAYKSAPVQYVRICDAYGSGFFYIPGTDTCLEVGGYVRFEMRDQPGANINNVFTGAVTQIAGAQDETGMQVRGRVDVDARTQTAWGTVQTVVHLRAANSDGIYNEGSATQFQTSFAPGGNSSSVLTMERAYIRFAGLTAGVSSENFSTMPAYMYGPTIYAGFPNGVKQLTYTATFGGGFSATIALESRGDLEGTTVGAGGGENQTVAGTPLAVPYAYNSEYTNRWDSGYALIGNVRYDASWGYFQANAAAVDNTVAALGLGGPSTSGASAYSALSGQTGTTGWAAGFSFRYNLPMIAPGDQFHFQFAYASGLNGLVESNGSVNNLSNSSGTTRYLGGIQQVVSDLIATSATATGTVTSVGSVQSYGVYGMFTHYWAPTWRSNVQVGYQDVMPPTAAASAGVQPGNAKIFGTAGNLIWSPTKNFDIGVELDYLHLTQTVQNPTAAFVKAGSPGLNVDGFSGIVRLERQF